MTRLLRIVWDAAAKCASVAAVVSFFLVLYNQFRDRPALWPGVVLGGAVLICWLHAWPRWTADTDGVAPSRVRAGRLLHGGAWLCRGGLLAVAAGYYGMDRLNDERLDGTLALLTAAMVGCALLQRWGRKIAGVQGVFPRGRSLVSSLTRWTCYILLGAAARVLGGGLAVAVFWVPVRALEAFRDWWSPEWLAIAAAVPVWLLWVVIFSLASGLLQVYRTVTYRETRAQHYGYSTHEWHNDTVLKGPPPRTLLPALIHAYSTRNDRTSYTSTQGGLYSASSTTTTYIYSRIVRFSFPPIYTPVWLTPLIRLLRRERRSEREPA